MKKIFLMSAFLGTALAFMASKSIASQTEAGEYFCQANKYNEMSISSRTVEARLGWLLPMIHIDSHKASIALFKEDKDKYEVMFGLTYLRTTSYPTDLYSTYHPQIDNIRIELGIPKDRQDTSKIARNLDGASVMSIATYNEGELVGMYVYLCSKVEGERGVPSIGTVFDINPRNL